MPKYGIHQIVLQDVIDRLTGPDASPTAQAAGALLEAHPFESALGAVGPDLFFFGVDYEIMAFANVFMPLLDWLDEIEAAVEEVFEPIEEIEEQLEDFVSDTLDAVGLGVINEVKDRLDRIERLTDTITEKAVAAGLLEGLNPLAPATTPGGRFTSPLARHVRELYENFLIPPSQMNADEVDWYWFDMLHYRETGPFARNLVSGASTDAQRAYALAYLTHVGTDLVGHPFVNQISGGPFRLGVQRHVTAENYMDVAAYRAREREPVYGSLADDMHIADDDHPALPDDLAELIAKAFRETYENTAHPRRHSDDGFYSAQDIKDTYVMFRRIAQRLGGSRLERLRPQPVTGSTDQDVADVIAAIDAVDPPPAPPPILPPSAGIDWESVFDGSATLDDLAAALGAAGSSLQEWFDGWMGAMAETAAWAAETAQQLLGVAKEMVEAGANTAVRPLLVLLHAAEMALYDLLRTIHAVFARNGLVYPLVDDIDDAISRSLWTIHDPFRHVIPQSAGSVVAERSDYPRLREKGQSHLVAPRYQPERRTTCAAFHRPDRVGPTEEGVPPEAFMTEEAFDPKALLAYATAATPLDTASLWADGQRIGNAADLCAWMIETAHDGTNAGALDVAFASWNLDGDRGYGYRSWSATLPHNWNIDVMGKLSIVLNDPPESPADTNFTAPDGVAVTADADGLLSAADAVHGLAVQAEGLVGGVPVFGADPSIFNDAGNDYRFGMIKAKDEAFVSQRSLADMRIANLVISEANVPASFASYTEQSPTAWRSLLAPRLATDPGAGRNGNIYHMNGVGTPAYDALYERHAVQHFLNLDPSDPTMRVRLVYNVSDPRLPVASLGQNLLAGDALSNQAEIISILDGVQAIRDKIWSFTLLAKVAGVASATEVRDFLTDTTTVPAVTDMRPPLPIRNASTIAVISLLYDAMASGTPLGLCGYSHGTQIIFNAICAFAFRGTQERDYLADRVRVAYFGRMVDVNSVGFLRLLVNDVMDMANPGDPISDILGNIPPDPMFLNAMSAVDIHLELADPTVQVALLEFINSIQADQHQFYRYAPRVRHDSPTLREVFTA